jgi:hypothetical protein
MLTRAYQKMMKKKGISPAPVINSARAREELVKVAHRKTLKHMAKQEGVRTFMRSKKRIRTDLMGRGRNG